MRPMYGSPAPTTTFDTARFGSRSLCLSSDVMPSPEPQEEPFGIRKPALVLRARAAAHIVGAGRVALPNRKAHRLRRVDRAGIEDVWATGQHDQHVHLGA